MRKHTPGPWQWDGNPCKYDQEKESPWLVTDAYALGIEKQLRGGVILKGGIYCLNEADAHLVAAAPEMYDALLAALEVLHPDFAEYKAARAAIAKARGEA